MNSSVPFFFILCTTPRSPGYRLPRKASTASREAMAGHGAARILYLLSTPRYSGTVAARLCLCINC